MKENYYVAGNSTKLSSRCKQLSGEIKTKTLTLMTAIKFNAKRSL